MTADNPLGSDVVLELRAFAHNAGPLDIALVMKTEKSPMCQHISFREIDLVRLQPCASGRLEATGACDDGFDGMTAGGLGGGGGGGGDTGAGGGVPGA